MFHVKQSGSMREFMEKLTSLSLTPNELQSHGVLVNKDGKRRSALELLSHPTISMDDITRIWAELGGYDERLVAMAEIEARYYGHVERQQKDVDRFNKEENMVIPEGIDYHQLSALSTEMREKLTKHQPANIGAASRIAGVTPAAIIALISYIRKREQRAA
jgi:tRNA uridine 5-carboxymethylaminomethyl modification enzyme